MGSVHLLGGGWDPTASAATWGPFLEEAGNNPTVACVLIDEGDGNTQFDRYLAMLGRAGRCRPFPVLIPLGRVANSGDLESLAEADALLVCGGLTPAYAAALVPVAPEIRGWFAHEDRPYAGFSAGAAIAARHAVVGGWRHGGEPVCPEDAGEDLDDVTVVAGLGLVDFAVDVHAAQWGTLPRLIAGLEVSDGVRGVAIDEDTALQLTAEGVSVSGLGAVHWVTRTPAGVTIESIKAAARA